MHQYDGHSRYVIEAYLPTEHVSVYDVHVQHGELAPTTDEARMYIDEVEQLYPDMTSLDRAIIRWYIM